jgi:hypothetical protein
MEIDLRLRIERQPDCTSGPTAKLPRGGTLGSDLAPTGHRSETLGSDMPTLTGASGTSLHHYARETEAGPDDIRGERTS